MLNLLDLKPDAFGSRIGGMTDLGRGMVATSRRPGFPRRISSSTEKFNSLVNLHWNSAVHACPGSSGRRQM
jgi:hypothetical protein